MLLSIKMSKINKRRETIDILKKYFSKKIMICCISTIINNISLKTDVLLQIK